MDLGLTAILLVAGLLAFVSILASILADKVGVPALLLFLTVGMLAGSDGPGGIHFDNPVAANLIGTVALAYILFSGGLDTRWQIIRPVAARGILLSTVGVGVTAGLVGVFTWQVLGFEPIPSFMLGAIISSTDAAAVFAVLRGRGVGIKGNLKPLLEFESGSNDPMAVLLTICFTRILTQPDFSWFSLGPMLVVNLAVGAAVGMVTGKLATRLFNRLPLEYEGLYPVLSVSLVLLTFGTAEYLMGNGFLAVYLCGNLLNSTNFRHKRYVLRFHDGLAWLMQIILFVVLGMLVFPSQLPAVAVSALLIALFLMFAARPAAVAVCTLGSAFNWRERVLLAWTGLRGAVPIVLATYPFLAGYEESAVLFNIVFFIVLTSVVLQGTLLMPVARLLRVDEPMASRPAFSFEIERKGLAQGMTYEVDVLPNMAAAGRKVMELGIPPDALILLIGRGDGFVVPRGHTRIEPYDTLLLLGDRKSLGAAHKAILSPPARAEKPESPEDPLATLPCTTEEKYLSRQVVVVGYGRVGRRICESLDGWGVPYVVVDMKRGVVEALREKGKPAVIGDGADPAALIQAHILKAAMLVIATPDTMKVSKMTDIARSLNPEIEVAIRCHSEMEANFLEKDSAGAIFLEERELAKNMVSHILQRVRRPATNRDEQT